MHMVNNRDTNGNFSKHPKDKATGRYKKFVHPNSDQTMEAMQAMEAEAIERVERELKQHKNLEETRQAIAILERDNNELKRTIQEYERQQFQQQQQQHNEPPANSVEMSSSTKEETSDIGADDMNINERYKALVAEQVYLINQLDDKPTMLDVFNIVAGEQEGKQANNFVRFSILCIP